MSRVRWPEATKDDAIRLAEQHGVGEASRRTGVPVGTIASWLNRKGIRPATPEDRSDGIVAAQLAWEERRTLVATKLGEVADKAVAVLLDKLAGGDVTVAQTLDVLEAAVGKAQLLTGAAQTRTESTVTNTKTKLIEEARVRAGHLRAVG